MITCLTTLAADPPPSDLNTSGIVGWMASKIVPILLAILGVIFIGRAAQGQVSRVLTSSTIAIIGLGFLAGAAIMFGFGQSIINTVFK